MKGEERHARGAGWRCGVGAEYVWVRFGEEPKSKHLGGSRRAER